MENKKKTKNFYSHSNESGQHMPGFYDNRSLLHFSQDISLEHRMSQ